MGITDRKSKHKEDLRVAILEAAKKLFLKDGYKATSIRKIANEIEFSPTTIYLYYKDKSEIMHALHSEGFKVLGSRFGMLSMIDHPFERLKAMGRIYMQFSLENSDLYSLMFVMKEPMEYLQTTCPDESWAEGEQAFLSLLNNIEACKAHGYFPGLDPVSVSMVAWSTLHGLCTLKLNGHLDQIKSHKSQLQHIDDVFHDTFNTFINILERIK